jgi:hypothetical protein
MFELDRTTRLVSESLARAMDRRTFLKRASQTTFAGLMALAVGQGLGGRAAAQTTDRKPPPTITCAPPGPYCNTGGGDLSGCHGGHCFQHRYNGQTIQCKVYYAFYQTGCWTTPVSGGYWTCCDCECLNSSGQRVATCGCAQFSTSPAPSPDGPGGKS